MAHHPDSSLSYPTSKPDTDARQTYASTPSHPCKSIHIAFGRVCTITNSSLTRCSFPVSILSFLTVPLLDYVACGRFFAFFPVFLSVLISFSPIRPTHRCTYVYNLQKTNAHAQYQRCTPSIFSHRSRSRSRPPLTPPDTISSLCWPNGFPTTSSLVCRQKKIHLNLSSVAPAPCRASTCVVSRGPHPPPYRTLERHTRSRDGRPSL